MNETVTCPNCDEEINISYFYQNLRELGLEDGNLADDEEVFSCENCESEITVSGSCHVDVNVYIDEITLNSVPEEGFSTLSDGDHEINDKIITVQDGSVTDKFSTPDENQFSLFE